MKDDRERAFRRARELRSQGFSWPQISDQLKREGFFDTTGKPFNPDSLRIAVSRRRKITIDMVDKSDNYDVMTIDKVDSPQCGPAPEIITKDEVIGMLKELETKVTNLIDLKIQAALEAEQVDVKPVKHDDPPLPPKVGKAGKKFAGTKMDLRARIDAVLQTLLEADCTRNYRGNMSRCLDAILWRYYGKPKLSFEEEKSNAK